VNSLSFVMPGLVPGIHALLHYANQKKDVDGRDKPGHDGGEGTAALYHRHCEERSDGPVIFLVKLGDSLSAWIRSS